MEYELYHHGILGMKWGVRRYQNKDGSLTPAGKKRYDRNEIRTAKKAYKTERRKAVAKRGEYSDTDLRKKVERLRLEKEYRELTNSEIHAGKVYTESLMKDIGKKVVVTAVSGAILYAGKAAVTKSFDAKEFGSAIFNGGPKKK